MTIKHNILRLFISVFLIITPWLFSIAQKADREINLWYGNHQGFGNAGFQQPMINIIGQVSNIDELYSLSLRFQGTRKPLPIGPTAFRLAEPGEFNIEIDRTQLMPGKHNLGIAATYKNGEEIWRQLTFDLENNTPVLPFQIDWSRTSEIQDVAQVVDGKWRTTEDGLRTMKIGYDRAIAIGDSSWRDYEVNLEFTVHSITDDSLAFGWPSMGAAMHVAVRWQGHQDWDDLYPRRGWTGFGALFSCNFQRDRQEKLIWIYDQVHKKSIKTTKPFILEKDEPYQLKSRVISRDGDTSLYKMKLWKKDSSEPLEWEIEAEGLLGEPENGSVLLVAHQADISFKNTVIKIIDNQ